MAQSPGEARERWLKRSYLPPHARDQERAFFVVKRAEGVEKKLKRAIRKGELPKVRRLVRVLDEALEKGILSKEEAGVIEESARVRREAIQVDSFTEEEYGIRRH